MFTLAQFNPEDGNFWTVTIIAAALLVFLGFLILLAKQYKRCPSNKVLVIYGKVGGGTSARCMHGGGSFVNVLSVAANNSAIPLKFMKGVITPTPLTRFEPTRFRLARLAPNRRRPLATIEAEVRNRPGIAHLRFDQIGRIAVSISADLSRYRSQQSAHLTYDRSA